MTKQAESLKAVSSILLVLLVLGCQNQTQQRSMKAKAQTGYAPINGLEMYYEIHGEGMPLVLIHGGGSTIQTTFGKILPILAEKYKVIAVELQAHGHTKDRADAETFEQDADDVAALLKYLKIDRAHIMGFSNGGNTTMQVCIRHPGVVKKLVIISAFYKRQGMIQGFFDGMNNASLDNMPTYLKDAYMAIEGNDSAGLQRMFERDKTRMLEFKDWDEELLASINAPSLIICGDKDVVTTEHAVEMSRKIPNSQLLILPGTHGSFIGEGIAAQDSSNIPELTVKVIQEFLDK